MHRTTSVHVCLHCSLAPRLLTESGGEGTVMYYYGNHISTHAQWTDKHTNTTAVGAVRLIDSRYETVMSAHVSVR